MKHSRLIEQTGAVLRRSCVECRHPISDFKPVLIDGRAFYNCRRNCGLVRTSFQVPDEWYRVHATSSVRAQFSRVPGAVMFSRGNEETEHRAAKARSRPPAAQAWFDYAHSEEYKYTHRYKSLHIVCTQLVERMLSDKVVEDAAEVFMRRGDTMGDALQNINWMVKQCLDMLRVNQAGPPRIRRKFFSSHFGLDHKAVREYKKQYKGEGSSRQGAPYRPPLLRLLDEIDRCVSKLEENI